LEVLAATTILAVGLVAIFGLTRSAHQRSVAASDLAAVELAVEATLNELMAKQSPIAPIPLRPIDGVRHWKLEVKLYDSPRSDLATLFINAQKFTPEGTLPTETSFPLVRWVPRIRCSGLGVRGSGFGVWDSESVTEFDDPF
jgi:hypothetical protein